MNTQEEQRDTSQAEKVIGQCQGCLKTAVLRNFACEACRGKYGEICGILFDRIRSDAEFASQFWACLTPGKKAGFVRIFGDPAAQVVKEESEKLLQQPRPEELWSPEPALQRLESHLCHVLLRRRSDPMDLVRAAGMLRGVWRELIPAHADASSPTEAGAIRGVPMMDSNLAFVEPIGDHGVRVALELLERCGGLESMDSDREIVHAAWVLLESSRPWSDHAWRRACAAASRRVSCNAPIGCATSFLVIAMARESRAHPGRGEELEALAQRATANAAPWAAQLEKVLTFRRMLNHKGEP